MELPTSQTANGFVNVLGYFFGGKALYRLTSVRAAVDGKLAIRSRDADIIGCHLCAPGAGTFPYPLLSIVYQSIPRPVEDLDSLGPRFFAEPNFNPAGVSFDFLNARLQSRISQCGIGVIAGHSNLGEAAKTGAIEGSAKAAPGESPP